MTESIQGLEGKKEEPPEPAPCPDCGKVHAPVKGAGSNEGRSAPGVSTNYVYCDNCKIYHRAGRAAPSRCQQNRGRDVMQATLGNPP